MINRGFTFDMKVSATATRLVDILSDNNVQMMSWNSINKSLPVGRVRVTISLDNCEFEIFKSDAMVKLEKKNEVFYKDPDSRTWFVAVTFFLCASSSSSALSHLKARLAITLPSACGTREWS